MASAIPVLPEDGSMITEPGSRRPSASAPSSIASATRSFTEPVGLWPSSLAKSLTDGLGLRRLTSSVGVPPISSSTER